MCPESYEQWRELVPRKIKQWERPDPRVVVCVSNDNHVYRDVIGDVREWNPAPHFKIGYPYTSWGLCVDEDETYATG